MTVIGSDLFDLDDDIKQYLQNPEILLITKIKIGLRYYITPELIIQMDYFKNHLKNINFFMLEEVFGKAKRSKT